MKRAAAALGVALFAATPALARHRRAPPPRPVVVELFTAQGCAACPQANALLQELAGRQGVLALTFPVDVWDYLGWADTFAKPEFSERQRAYVARFKLRELYTPQMVVDGRRETLGFEREKVQALVEAAPSASSPGPAVRLSPEATRAVVGAGPVPARGAEVWLVRYDPMERTVKVKTGENKGKTVVQQNVVRDIVRLGSWSGRGRSFRLPAPVPGLRSVVLLQGDRGGPILAEGAG